MNLTMKHPNSPPLTAVNHLQKLMDLNLQLDITVTSFHVVIGGYRSGLDCVCTGSEPATRSLFMQAATVPLSYPTSFRLNSN